jgi:hypothetical protein
VILIGGYDGTCEELYVANGAAALARGYNVLAFDGPGQGSVLTHQRLALRVDWENVIGPVLCAMAPTASRASDGSSPRDGRGRFRPVTTRQLFGRPASHGALSWSRVGGAGLR